ncbi:ABC-type antimicrobial peptide transport system, permease component [Thioflavicoccus mobilis 8321]|uniref:ABC-type antimicrobial peptide transport system, permease component n=1 Tax=Thioflavicoccus mobilis 8321 TaxID=765912 RepID=L0GWL7_9GAMM|nr:ABC transporter permease [Thioflavicoccus mobilis]AGA90222.1 ABC-type antimicrobial peptide transport system, permease component [Thioflavicoccus mobilis 8321]
MQLEDLISFTGRSFQGFRFRTLLLLLAMSIGVASVVLLTSLGEASRRYIASEFAELGTHLLVVLPGRSETTGKTPPALGTTPRDLTLDDAIALYRSPAVRHVAPLLLGGAPASHGARERDINVLGSTNELALIRKLEVIQGSFLPPGDPAHGTSVCVLGQRVKRELFGTQSPLGEWIRLNDRRFRVIGVLADKGTSIGIDFNEVVIIPVASAQILFNKSSLLRILVEAKTRDQVPRAEDDLIDIIRKRHDGEEDVTVIVQDAVLTTFDQIFQALTLTVGGIAAVSLAVAGVLIMNVMLVSVYQRTSEIGLMKAIGARNDQILAIFLAESALLSLAGATLGVLASLAVAWATTQLLPDFPLHLPLWSFAGAIAMAIATGLLFGIAPARRAAGLDPVSALTRRG